MKIVVSIIAILLIAPVLLSDANAAELVSRHAALIQQGCQMGSEDAKSGKSMDSSGISLKNSGDKYIELEALIRKEYEKCYAENNSTITSTPVSSTDNNNSDSIVDTFAAEETTEVQVDNEEYSENKIEHSELKLPPGTSEKPFAWFYEWVSVVEEAAGRYTSEKERAEGLREEFKKTCHKAYLIGQDDKTLIDRWCKIKGWKEFSLDNSALRDEHLKQQLEQMKQQIGFSEQSFSLYGNRDVKNAFDREKGSSFNYQMNNLEQQKVLPYLSGVTDALGNIKATNFAMENLDKQKVSKRKKEYLAELGKAQKRRIEEKKKQAKSEKNALIIKQKPLAGELLNDACNIAREDAVNLKVPLPNQFKSQAKTLNMIKGLEGQVATRYTECFDAELISLTCIEAGDDYMKCRNAGPRSKFVSLASNKMPVNAFKAEYKKCHQERKKLYAREKIEREKAAKNILNYIEIYRQKGGYFINDYNECVGSIISATNKLSRKDRFSVLSNNNVRSCEDDSSLIAKYASKSCSCNYGVIVETLDEHKFTEFSDDILTLIKSSHSSIGNKAATRPDEAGLKSSLRHPDASTALFKKINLECAM